mmetsp:Transcript_768/g.822  ORF Transcript_768/g.822 Transcript_768/m.822 type:complete len:88 (+) Transcript_768:254-517(+)
MSQMSILTVAELHHSRLKLEIALADGTDEWEVLPRVCLDDLFVLMLLGCLVQCDQLLLLYAIRDLTFEDDGEAHVFRRDVLMDGLGG